jgi:hypothetical protein
MPQSDELGPGRLEEVFIKQLLIFLAAEHNSKNKKHNKCEYIKYSASVGNNDMQAYIKKGLIHGLFAQKASRLRHLLSMTMHLDYHGNQGPQAHRSHTCSQN